MQARVAAGAGVLGTQCQAWYQEWVPGWDAEPLGLVPQQT